MLGLHWGAQTSLVAACGLSGWQSVCLVVLRHVGSQFPGQGLNQRPPALEGGVLAVDHQGSPASQSLEPGFICFLTLSPPSFPVSALSQPLWQVAGRQYWKVGCCLGWTQSWCCTVIVLAQGAGTTAFSWMWFLTSGRARHTVTFQYLSFSVTDSSSNFTLVSSSLNNPERWVLLSPL